MYVCTYVNNHLQTRSCSYVKLLRLRWLSHNTSRLRIYFGSIRSPPSSIKSTMLKDFHNMTGSIAPFLGIHHRMLQQPSMISYYNPLPTVGSHHISAAKKLLVLGCKGEKFASHVMERLYALTPASAIGFTINDRYQPLFSTAKLDSLEFPRYNHYNRGSTTMHAANRHPATNTTAVAKHHQQLQKTSPGSRQQQQQQQQQNIIVRVHDGMKNKAHEGIRRESDGFMDYKCFGDMRLTIVQIESALYGRQGDEFFDYFEPLRNVQPDT